MDQPLTAMGDLFVRVFSHDPLTAVVGLLIWRELVRLNRSTLKLLPHIMELVTGIHQRVSVIQPTSHKESAA